MIEIRGLTYRYPNGTVALDGVDLTIPVGQFVGVLGANGSGKSTLVRHLNGLLEPESGEVRVDGLLTSDPQVRRLVGLVFQNPESQLVAPVVEDDVAFGLENQGLPREEIRRRVDQALRQVDMASRRRSEPHLLSGGQKQRVALAGVLACQPRYLVLDESTTMLDPRGREEVLATVHQLRRELGLTVLFVTHRLEELEGADRLVLLESGRIVEDGPYAEVLPRLAELPPALDLGRRLGVQASSESELVSALRGRPLRPLQRQERPSRPPWLALERLSHVYLAGTPYETPALQEVSLTVGEGECLGVAGTTGSGKSTLIQHLNGVLPPQQGRVQVGTLTMPADRLAIRAQVGLVFQFPEHQLFEDTVRAEVAFGPRNFGVREPELSERVDWALDQVGLAELDRNRSPFDLSGGEKRRLALASVLASRPRCLVLDEPTAGLDPAHRRELLSRLGEWKASGTALVIVSHHLDELADLVDRVAVLEGGRLKALGPLRDVPLPLPWPARLLQQLGLEGPLPMTEEEALACLTQG